MPAVDYAPNTPRWVDFGSPDIEVSKRFYSQLFGWEPGESDPSAGGYFIFNQGGRSVAGGGPLMMEGQPTVWQTYVYVDDADAVAARVGQNGGTVLVQPMDVMGMGKMAVFLDPQGAAFAAWQPVQHMGADLFNEPNAMCWNELASPDVEASKAFYGKVFGWSGETQQMGPATYTEFKANGQSVAGMRQLLPEDRQMGIPPHWLVYFAVADPDAIATRAAELGGAVLQPPFDIPVGRMAVLRDPVGATFAIIRMGGTPGA